MINHLRIQLTSLFKVQRRYLKICCLLIFYCTVLFSPVASAPTNLMAVQEGLTSIRVSWSPPTPLGDTTGYRIYYSDSDSSDSVDVSGGSTDNYLLTGLQNGEKYTISIMATSEHFDNATDTIQINICTGEKSSSHKMGQGNAVEIAKI